VSDDVGLSTLYHPNGPDNAIAWGDYNNDGWQDIYSAMAGGHLVRNQGDGTNINRDALGAIVRIPFGSEILTRQVESAMGWGNQNDKTLHFGLGTNSSPVTVITTWPDSHVQTNTLDIDKTATIFYNIIASKINLSGNGYGINNGSTTPSTANGTDFRQVHIEGDFARKTFKIENSGNINLQVSDVLISDTSAFQVTTYPSGSIAPGGETTFKITFDPKTEIVYTGTVSIANNDNTANPFTFMIKGEGIPEPYPFIIYYLLFIINYRRKLIY